MSADLNIQKILGKIDKLPTLPYVVTTLNDLIRNPNTSAADINKVIMRDQAISSRILKLVNSAFYGFTERISSISHAIVILGFNTVKNVALTASVFDLFAKAETGGIQFDRKGFWLHSIATATTARLIATRVKLPNVEDIFVAGLLHDIGKLVLDQFVSDKFGEVLTIVHEKNVWIKEAEEEVLDGVNHCQIGAWLGTKWKLPNALVQLIGFHHRPPLGEQFIKAISCLHLADILVRAMGVGNGGDKKIPCISKEAWESLGLTYADIQALLAKMEDELSDAEAFIQEVS